MTVTSTPGSNLWFSVWKLLRLRVVIFTSGFRRARLRNKLGIIALGLVLLCGGVALRLEVSFLLASMCLGTVVANLARHHMRPFMV